MRKSTRIAKRLLALFLVVLMSINTLGAVVSDNDGSAFITKAEFDSLKNDFQSQIDQYNTSIDSKIDGAIASYLAGVRVAQVEDMKPIINKKYVWLETVGDDNVLGWKRVNNAITYDGSCNVYFFRTYIGADNPNIRQGSVGSKWSPKSENPEKKEVYSFDKVTSQTSGYLINPSKDKRSMSGMVLIIMNFHNNMGSRFMTSNWASACPSLGSIQYNTAKTAEGASSYETGRKAKWQEGLVYGQEFTSVPLSNFRPTAKYPNNQFKYSLSESDGVDPTLINEQCRPGQGNIVNFTVATGINSNYMMGMAGATMQQSMTWNIDDEHKSLLGLVGEAKNTTIQFYDNEASNIYAQMARTCGNISKSELKYDITGYGYFYYVKPPYVANWDSNNTLTMDATYSYETTDIIPAEGIRPWYNASDTLWPNTIPFDWIIPSIWLKKTVDKSKLAYYNSDIVNVSETTALKNYFDNYSWNRGFPMWISDNNGVLTFKPEFENTSDTYLVWCLKGPSDSNIPYTTAPSNYYSKNVKCTLTQIVSGNGKGAIKCKSGDKIIIDDIKKNDIVYLYFTTEDGKAGPKLKSQIQASLEKE